MKKIIRVVECKLDLNTDILRYSKELEMMGISVVRTDARYAYVELSEGWDVKFSFTGRATISEVGGTPLIEWGRKISFLNLAVLCFRTTDKCTVECSLMSLLHGGEIKLNLKTNNKFAVGESSRPVMDALRHEAQIKLDAILGKGFSRKPMNHIEKIKEAMELV